MGLVSSSMVISLLLGLTLFYVASVLLLLIGLFRLKEGNNREQPLVSVVIPARNEEDKIGRSLSCLVAQDYPQDKFEVIVVDDRSTDRTTEVVQGFSKQYPQIRLLQVKDISLSLAPKKRALDLGIRGAQGQIILTTDADCCPRPGWISGIVRHFEPGVGLVAGFSPIEPDGRGYSWWEKFLALDSLALATVAAGGIGLGLGLTCTGRNLAYRKEVYQGLGGFGRAGRLPSGDDDLFLQSVNRNTHWKLRYATSPKTQVPTDPPQGLREFIEQRKRHGSKGFYYPRGLTGALILVYLYNILLLITVPLSLISLGWSSMPLFSLTLKALTEFLLLLKGGLLFRKLGWLTFFPLGELLHIPYVVIFGAWGTFGKYRWKEEVSSTKG